MTGGDGQPASFEGATEAAIAAYAADGVVCLRQVFARRWIDLALAGLRRNLARPGRFFRDHTRPGAEGRYLFEFWSWPETPEFRDLIFDSPAGELAGRLLGARETRLVMDNWFLREAGAVDAAPWHHDEPYFDFHGPLCILWLPLEAASAHEGLTFVAGSHRSGHLFAIPQFSDSVPFTCEGPGYAPLPAIDAAPERHRLLKWDVQVGDCLVFDFRTLHAATARGQALTRTLHRMTLRFGSEAVRFRPRGTWTREISDHLMAQGQAVDAPLDTPLTPKVWSRS